VKQNTRREKKRKARTIEQRLEARRRADARARSQRPFRQHNLVAAEIRRLARLRRVPVERANEAARNLDPFATPRERGEALGLTFAQFCAMHPTPKTLRPCDATDDEVVAFLRDKRRQRDKLHQSAKRAKKRARDQSLAKHHDLDSRAEVVFVAIGGDWTTIAALAKTVANHAAFRMANGRRLTGDGLRRAVDRALRDLVKSRLVEREMARKPNGVPVAKFQKADAICHQDIRTSGQVRVGLPKEMQINRAFVSGQGCVGFPKKTASAYHLDKGTTTLSKYAIEPERPPVELVGCALPPTRTSAKPIILTAADLKRFEQEEREKRATYEALLRGKKRT